MSTCTGGGFGGSYLAEHLLRTKKPRIGELANYWDKAHWHRVQASDRKRTKRAAQLGVRPPPPMERIPRVWTRSSF